MRICRYGLPAALLVTVFATLILGVGGAQDAAAMPAGPDAPTENAGWVEIGAGSASGGGISNTNRGSFSPSLALAPDGAPVVAWSDTSNGNSEIYVRRWNGSVWAEMGSGSASGGGISNNVGYSSSPSLAIGPDGAPVVAWYDDSSGNQEIYVRRWNGSVWAEMGSGSASGGGISSNSGLSNSPSLAIGPDGAPVVAWGDRSSSNEEIYVRRWNGSAWAEMGSGSASGGGISNNNGWSFSPSLAIGPDGAPVVAWTDDSSGNQEIYVRRWNGSAWVEMGIGSTSGGGISNNGGWSSSPSLAVGPDGAPIVAWQDYSSGNYEIYVRRWNGAAWVEVGAGSASGGGISNTANNSFTPSLAIGPDGAPVVAWTDTWDDGIISNEEIYARRWNGSAWVGMGGGSFPGWGISDNGGTSLSPSLAIGPTGVSIVAWSDDSSGPSFEIYVRRYQIPCYTLTRAHTGSGGDPAADPANSAGCPNGQYTDGQSINVIASPASGWRVAGWAGTNNNGSTSNTNTVTMPAGNLTVGVVYEPIPPDCHTLSRAHSGSGGDPTANPANSTGCPANQYTAGQSISLTASPAAGHRVKSWNGTDNNSSTSTTNTVTMPANNHTISVTYEMIPIVNTEYFTFFPLSLRQPPPCFPGPHEQEPNNSQSQANGPLCRGRVYTGLPNDLWDMYYFDTTQSGEVTAAVTDIFGGGKQVMQLLLYYGAVGGNSVASDVDDGDGLSVTLPAAQPGRYYVVVYTKSPDPTETRPYRLSLSFP